MKYKTLRQGIMKRIHVNQHEIRHNTKTGDNRPVLTCKTSSANDKANTIQVLDDDDNVVLTLGYSDNPLACGARVWIETKSKVKLLNLEEDECQ